MKKIRVLLLLISVPAFLIAEESLSESIEPSSVENSSEFTSLKDYAGEDYDARYWILKGLDHNFSLQIGRMEVLNSTDRVTISLGSLAPRLTSAIRYRESERAQNRQQFLALDEIDSIFEEKVASLELRLEDRFAFGTQVAITSSTSRLDNTTNRNINPSTLTGPLFFPEYQTTTQLQVIQPLLKNRGVKTNLAATNLARSEGLGTEFQLRSEVDRTIAQILVAFAETEFGLDNLRVKVDAVQLANDLIDQNRRRVEEGVMSPIDVTQAEARLAEAKEEVVGARTFLAERQNRLLELTGTDYTFGQEAPIRGSVSDVLKAPEKDRIVIGQEMLVRNPIYLAALERARAEGIRVAFAKNQLLPQLDLEATVGTNGLEDSFGGSFEDFSNRDRLDWSVGLVLSMSLDRSADRAQVSLAKRVQAQALMTAKQTEVQLLVLLDNSMREVEAAQERIGFANEAVRLAEEALRSEERRLSSGLTTSYNVLNQQRDLSFARTRALASEVELFRAVAQLYVVTGSLGDQLNLDLTFAAN
ncbi:MAG: TolC family protein [Verrucomicrobiota bacterium]